MKPYVTLFDVAAAVGLSVTTVSLALRRHPKIPEATRLRVRKVADEMGYRPNPMLSSLAAYRTQVKGAKYQATIGVISNSEKRGEWRQKHPYQEVYWQGAAARCRELGFTLEEFWLREPKMTADRLAKILLARNIRGLLLLPQPRARSHIHFPWEHFSTVAFGMSLTRPQFNLVGVNHFHSGVTVMRRLRGLGYRRIGFLAVHEVNERIGTTLLGGYLVEREKRADLHQVPPLILRRAQLNQEAFSHWYLEHRPDAVFVLGVWSKIVLEWIDALKIRVPEDLGLAFSSVEGKERIAGINEHIYTVGIKAVELVKVMLDRGETGIPDIPLRILVEGTWQQGETVRRLTR